jgi:hypothetical protein
MLDRQHGAAVQMEMGITQMALTSAGLTEKPTYFKTIVLICAQSEGDMWEPYAGARKKLSLQSCPFGTFHLADCYFLYTALLVTENALQGNASTVAGPVMLLMDEFKNETSFDI